MTHEIEVERTSVTVGHHVTLKKADVEPSFAGSVLTVRDVTSPRTTKGFTPTTAVSTVRVVGEIVVVLVEAWCHRQDIGGVYAFRPGPTGWRRVSVTRTIRQQITASGKAPEVVDYFRRKDAYNLARVERSTGLLSFVDPDTGELLRFEQADMDAAFKAKGSYTSQAKLVRALRAAKEARLSAEPKPIAGWQVLPFKREVGW